MEIINNRNGRKVKVLTVISSLFKTSKGNVYFENSDGTGFTFQLVIPSSLKTVMLYCMSTQVLGGYLEVDKSLGKLKECYYIVV